MDVTDKDVKEENGFLIIKNFLSPLQVAKLTQATIKLVDKYCKDIPLETFSSDIKSRNRNKGNYFSESGDKIRGFYEEKAIVDGKVIIPETGKALNKIGHALHTFADEFREVTMNPRVKNVANKLTNMAKPGVIQSMVIFKHPQIGGEVKPHQDATYLYTDPPYGSLLGFWIALDEATLKNGCLKFAPGSHKPKKVYQRMIRNPDAESHEPFIYVGDVPPKFSDEELVSAEVEPGDLVLIDGLVIHQSSPNTSDKARLAYTFHVLDLEAEYSPDNWLQPTNSGNFEPFL